MFNTQIYLLIIIALGYFLKRLGVLNKDDAKPLSTILIDLMLPALIISTFSKTDITGQLGLISIGAIIVLSTLLIFGWFISRKYEIKTAKSFTILMGTYWGATLAFPFILGTYGEEGFKIFLFYDIIGSFFASTIIPYIAVGNISLNGLKRLFTNPLFLSLLIAIILNISNFSSSFTDDLFAIISKGIVFIGLLIVGLNLELNVSQWKRPLLIIVPKLLIGLALGLLIVYAFDLSGLHKTVLIIAATLPPSLMAMIFSQKYNLDKELAANTLTLALPISIIVMTLISLFV